jgi:hypothetical protein
LEYLYDENIWKAGEFKSTEGLKTIMPNSGESSTVYLDHLGLYVKFFPTSNLGFSLYYTSDIEGPWKLTNVLNDIGSPYNQFVDAIYAIKIHRELSTNENEIVVSLNSLVSDLSNAKGYVPLFISIKIKKN